MRARSRLLLPLSLLALAGGLAQGADPAWGRAGNAGSFGSRGARTYTLPGTSPGALPGPNGATPVPAPFMPRAQPAEPAPYGIPAYPPRRPWLIGGLLGGLLGAGVFGLAFGHGLFGGIQGMAGTIGFLVQVLLLVLLVRFLLQRLSRPKPAPAVREPPPPRPQTPPPALQRADYEAFEALLREVQAAWTAKDQARMRELATPEMVAMFGGQLAELARNAQRNSVTDIRLEEGRLTEAWRENGPRGSGRDYATVAMRFSMVDVTRDARGYVVDGSPDEHVVVTELWTFVREDGGRWLLSAIQQGR